MQGLIKAVAEVFPESKHRFCVRHLYSNFQQHFKGENLKNQLWACARSTTPLQFHKNMEKMKVFNEKVVRKKCLLTHGAEHCLLHIVSVTCC